MIWHEVTGGSPEWARLRLGIPCSSEFHKLLTPKTRKVSSQATGYMYRLLAEWVTGEPCENESTEWMQRGQELEARARSAYELLTDSEVTIGGFFTTDDGLIGCSPDGLIGDNGDLELKCPLIATQIGYALGAGVDTDYMTQLQGRLMIHGREWVDIFAYHPRFSIPPVRVYRDEEFIRDLSAALAEFVDKMIALRERLERDYGPFVRTTDGIPAEAMIDTLGVSDADVDAIFAARGRNA